MRLRVLAIVAVTLMALVPATSAVADVTCGQMTQTGPGIVEMDVSTSHNSFWGFTVIDNVGDVQLDLNDCTTNVNACTLIAIGTPGLILQSITVRVEDSSEHTADCTCSQDEGLPVELIEFSVE